MNIKDLIKDNTVAFLEYRKGYLYYTIKYQIGVKCKPDFSYAGSHEEPIYEYYKFPVPIVDVADATFKATDKAIYFMRYIQAAIKEGALVKL